jgi:vitamin B12 transport system permease protein
LLVGAALALSGAIMQALFENPLAEPGLLGVSNGAGVGLIAAVLLGKGLLPGWALGLCAIAGALVITLILLRFARRHMSTSRLLLAGVALGIICSALMTWAIYFSTSFDLRQLMYWMMGGFGGVDWQQSWLMVALLPVMGWTCFQSQPLNVLRWGDICPSTRATSVVLAQCAGGGNRLDGGRQRRAGWLDWLYRAGYPPYSASLRAHRPSCASARLRACGGDGTAVCRYRRPNGAERRRITYRCRDGNAGGTGVHLALANGKTLRGGRHNLQATIT